MFLKATPWRCVTHRKNVAALACVNCGAEGMTQAAHRNEGKGMAIKACDSQLMALCWRCHSAVDQGGKYSKATRREMERGFVDLTRERLIARGQWPIAAERAYEKVNG